MVVDKLAKPLVCGKLCMYNIIHKPPKGYTKRTFKSTKDISKWNSKKKSSSNLEESGNKKTEMKTREQTEKVKYNI